VVGEVLVVAGLTTQHRIDLADLLPEHGTVKLGLEGKQERGRHLRNSGLDALATLTHAQVLTHRLFRKNTVFIIQLEFIAADS
jgi:hypothetical protein